jgi:hypothetical protein
MILRFHVRSLVYTVRSKLLSPSITATLMKTTAFPSPLHTTNVLTASLPEETQLRTATTIDLGITEMVGRAIVSTASTPTSLSF